MIYSCQFFGASAGTYGLKIIPLSREIDVSPDTLRSVLVDAELYSNPTGRWGFDVALLVWNWIDINGSELAVRIIRHDGAVLAYVQINELFETVPTRYMVDAARAIVNRCVLIRSSVDPTNTSSLFSM